MGQREHEAEVRKTDQKLLAAEAALLLLLRRKIRRQVLPLDPWVARATLVQLVAGGLLTGRAAANSLGLIRLNRELATIDPTLVGLATQDANRTGDKVAIGAGLLALLGGGRARLRAGAESYADRWLRLVREAQEADQDNAYEWAFKRAEPRLSLVAGNETELAFNEARQRRLEQLSRDPRVAQLDLVRVWHVSWKKTTCSKCGDMDGKWVPLGVPFSIGEPGTVHTRCGCSDDVVPRAWVDDLDYAAAA